MRKTYLHHCHTNTDSQDHSTVFQEPFLHAECTALDERTKEGTQDRKHELKTDTKTGVLGQHAKER